MGKVFDYLAGFLDAQKVCSKCRDKTKCKDCAFNRKGGFDAEGNELPGAEGIV